MPLIVLFPVVHAVPVFAESGVIECIGHHHPRNRHLIHLLQLVKESFAEAVPCALGNDSARIAISGSHSIADEEDDALLPLKLEILHANLSGSCQDLW